MMQTMQILYFILLYQINVALLNRATVKFIK